MSGSEAVEAARAEHASPPASHRTTRTAHRSLARPHSTLTVARDHDYRNASTGASSAAAAAAAYSHPVELQVETMSSISTRIFLYSWYTVLAIALVVESNVSLQWVSRNFCGDATVSAYHLEDWNSSSCLTWEAYWVRPEHDRRMRTGGASESCAPSSISLLHGGGGAAGSAGKCPYAWVAWPPTEEVTEENGEDRADVYRTRTRTATPALASLSSSSSSHEEEGDNTTTTTTTTTFNPSPRPTMTPLRRVYQLRWTANALSGMMDRELNRFLHVYLSLASPLTQGADSERAGNHRSGFGHAAAPPPPPSWKVFEVLVALEETSFISLSAEDGGERRTTLASDVFSASSSETSSSSGSGRNGSRYVYTYKASVTCYRTAGRCSNLVLPASVVIPVNHSRLSLTLIDVEAELAEATVRATKAASCTAREHVDAPFFFSGASVRVLRILMGAAPPAPSSTSTLTTTGVGVMYQRGRFTLGTMLFRYASLLVTVTSALRFLYRSRSAPRMIFEQKWTLGLQLGLLLYLNPLYWWCIYAGAASHDARRNVTSSSFRSALASHQSIAMSRSLWYFTLYFVEFHIPTYFVTLVVCYIWSVVGGSFRWSTATAPTTSTTPQPQPPQAAEAPQPATPTAAAAAGTAGAPSARVDVALPDPANSDDSVGVTVPVTVTVSGSHLARRRVRVFLVLFTVTVSLLDTAKLLCEDGGPLGEWGDVTCRTPRCLLLQRSILYVILGGILSSGVGLYWLRRNLARHPYLSTRPQQLACRIMIFIYFTGGLYCVLQALLLETLYAQLMAIIYYQPLVQLSHLLVLTSFVIHMTYVYTTTQSSLQIPLRPNDPRWKTVGWSTRWYRWLDWHGGSLYVFFNEAEERRFYEVQVEHELAKRERKGRRAALRAQRKAEKKGNLQRQQQQLQRGLCAGAPPQLPDGDAESTVAGAGSRTVSAHPHGRTLPNGRGEGGRDGVSWEDVVAANLSGSLRHAANARSTTTANLPPAPLPRPPPFAMSTNTFSALSEPEETDWLLPPDDDAVGTAARQDRHHHRSLSTVTQASSNTSEGGDGGLGDSQHTAGASVRTSSHTPSAASSFPPAAMPAAVLGDATAGDVDDALASSRRQRTSTRVLSRVSSRVLVALHGAESRLVEGTATLVDLLAEKCVDLPLQVLLRQRARQRYVFFNLETAIDCLNLSREAYAVQESKGDDMIRTGIQVDAGQVPRAAVTFVERVVAAVFGLCFKNPPLEPDTMQPAADDDDGDAEEDGHGGGEATVVAVDDAAGLMASTPPAATEGKLDAAPQPDRATTPLTSPSHGSRTEAKEGGKGWQRVLAKVTGGDDGGDDTTAAAAAAADSAVVMGARVESPSTPPRPTQSPRPPSSSSSPRPISPTSLASPASSPPPQLLVLPHMNVEQYGYSPVAVFDTRGVQVVVARMDVSGDCPVHTGKLPRLTIAFRGTNSVANVLEDIRFQQRTWKEMETPTLLPRASVHSGFLELWMSLKEAVMDVVLRELRGGQQTEDVEEDVTAVAVDGGGDGSSATPTAAPRDAVPASDVFHTAEPFTSHWSAPAHQGTQDGRRSGFLRVYVTGHSLGGALACLCAYSLRRMLLLLAYPEPDVVVYTFGQPRIGNSVFKQHYNRAVPCTFRVVNESDAVSGFNILGGHHVGVQVNVDRHGNYVCKPMYIERLLRPTRGRGLALLNHKLAAYASSLNAVADVYAHGACPVRCLEPYVDAIDSVSSTESEGEECGGMDGQAVRLLQREEVEDAKTLESCMQ